MGGSDHAGFRSRTHQLFENVPVTTFSGGRSDGSNNRYYFFPAGLPASLNTAAKE